MTKGMNWQIRVDELYYRRLQEDRKNLRCNKHSVLQRAASIGTKIEGGRVMKKKLVLCNPIAGRREDRKLKNLHITIAGELKHGKEEM